MSVLDRIVSLFTHKPAPAPKEGEAEVWADILRRDMTIKRLEARVNAKSRRAGATNTNQ